MKATTVRIPENTKESIDSEADEYGLSTSEYVRKLIEYGREYYGEEDVIAELEERAEEIEAERDELADRVADLEADLADAPDPERVTELSEQLSQREDRIAELEAEVESLEEKIESLEARNTDLTNQLAEANSRIDAANELVEYVDDERNAQQRWREAGLLGKAKYTIFGMPVEESKDAQTD